MEEEENGQNSQPARLKVSHTDEGGYLRRDSYLRRDIYLFLDGKEFAILKSGREVVTKITPGRHSLRVYNTFQSKVVEFHGRSGVQVHYKTRNRKGFGSWMIEILGAGPLYLILERVAE